MITVDDETLAEARALSDAGKYDEAIKKFSTLLGVEPVRANAQLGIGVALIRQKRYTEAGDFLMSCGGTEPELYINAASAYALSGDSDKEWQALLRIAPTRHVAEYHDMPFRLLAQKATERKQWAAAYSALMALFEVNSEEFAICYQLGIVCKELGKLKHAVTFLLKARELCGADRKALCHAMMAGLYKDCGEQQSALIHFREAYKLEPNRNSCSNLIMAMQYTHGVSLSEFYTQCREYSDRYIRYKPRCTFSAEKFEDTTRPLRIGFVSGDLSAHSLTNLMLKPFQQFKNVSPHEILLYYTKPLENEDEWSDKYKAASDKWVNIHDKTDREAAELIFDDRIDILIDLAGHTAYNRLPVFGFKPAPVQMGWISGMMTPPAIETINYFITDPYLKPPNAEEVCYERLSEIEASYTYYPICPVPDIGSLPADQNGHITFGSFNNPCKISDDVIYSWSDCIRRVPRSRMIIKVYTKDTERYILRKMELYGVDADRLSFVYHVPSCSEVMQIYTDKIDIVLDTWPCAGMLTSLEAMWMGCPVATRIGDTFLHRQTYTVLNQIDPQGDRGFLCLGTASADEFAEEATRLAGDRARLRFFRDNIRDWMEESPIRQPVKIAQSLMRACEGAWLDWANSRQELYKLPRLI